MSEVSQAQPIEAEPNPPKKGTARWKAAAAVTVLVLVAGLSVFVALRVTSGTFLCVPAAAAGEVDGVYAFERETTNDSGETFKWLDVVAVAGRYASVTTYNRLGTPFPLVEGSFDFDASKAFWNNNTSSSLVFSRESDKVVVTSNVTGESQSYVRLGTAQAEGFEGNWRGLASRLSEETAAEAQRYQTDSEQ